jgi:DNA-binding NarL/FixJ family response regulator
MPSELASKKRIVVCECGCGDPNALRAALPEAAEVVSCATSELLLETILQAPPDLLVYQLGAECHVDVGVLRLVRRSSSRLPFIIVSESPSLRAQRLIHELRPIYFTIAPVEAGEFHELIQAALAAARRGAPRALPTE